MALVVEDGTGLANADAFYSLANVAAYHLAQGNTTWASSTYTDTQREAAIRRATAHLSQAMPWKGVPTNQRDQALAWPRAEVVDHYGYAIAINAVPTEVQKATAEVALVELVTPGAMSPSFTALERVKRVGAGPASVEYDTSRNDAAAARPELLGVQAILAGLLASSGSRLSGGAARS